MSYRIWINAFDMGFMSTRTESNIDAARGIASAIARAIPNATVGVDSVENDCVWHRIGEDVRVSPRAIPQRSAKGE